MAGSFNYEFDRSIFEVQDDDHVMMNHMTVLAQHAIRPDGELDHFTVVGRQYRCVVNLRAENGGIDVVVFHSNGDKPLSIAHPRNQDGLLRLINMIASDFEDRLDMAGASA